MGVGAHNFPKSIRPNDNVMAQLEFELAFYDVTVTSISTNI